MNADRSAKRTAEPSRTTKTVTPISHSQATRETFESIVIAVILAFLFRGFVAEAFVIPTGSMAPTLQGRHVDVECPECGFDYRAGASEENDRRGVVVQTFCPICQFPLPLIPPEVMADIRGGARPPDYVVASMRPPNQRSFNGDRILVSKFAYELNDPERWDVIVFKYPGNAKQNYIKRLVGLPNELIRIRHGDIYSGQHLFDVPLGTVAEEPPGGEATQPVPGELRGAFAQHGVELSAASELVYLARAELPDRDQFSSLDCEVRDPPSKRVFVLRTTAWEDSAEFTEQISVYAEPTITRKPPHKLLALMQRVDDTKYRSTMLQRLGWPERWQQRAAAEPAWEQTEQGHFRVAASDDQFQWLRYRHIYPTEREWYDILEKQALPEKPQLASGELITDYYTYNDRLLYDPERDRMLGYHWVGDLALEGEVEVQSAAGELALDLVEGGVHFRCTIDLATGQAALSRSDGQPFGVDGDERSQQPSGATPMRGPGSYELKFANADNELLLWVNGELVIFDGPTTYQRTDEVQPRWSEEDPGDLSPLGVGARGAEVVFQRLLVWRDVYYIAVTRNTPDNSPDYRYSGLGDFDDELDRVLHDGRTWQSTDLFRSRRTVEFVLGPDQFFPLGDNSPQSLDGRKWDEGPFFERDLLIGKAIYIYWPHSWRRPIPFLTMNLKRMRFIH